MNTPDRVEAVKDEFRACETMSEVNAKAKEYAEFVSALNASAETRVFAIHIKNLAAYMRIVLTPHHDSDGQASLF